MEPINLAEKVAALTGPYQPGIVAQLNDYKVQVAKIRGPFVWHKHDETDELFLVLDGELVIHLRDGDVRLGPGELVVVPRGVEHRPEAAEDAHVLLIEPRGTVNTGDAGGALTAEERWL
jgi:mannose-6-phosphate isomerase-like protein (cupin superfamily)